MVRPLACALTAVAALAAAPAALAQYRPNQPEVLTPDRPPTRDAGAEAVARLRAAYEKAGAPRVAVYWNRSLTSDPVTRYEARASVREDTAAGLHASISRSGRHLDVAAGSTSTTTMAAGERRVDDEPRRAAPQEREDWAVEAAFKSRLQSTGLRLVDQAVNMRVAAAGRSAEERRDVKTIETQALADKSDILVEVLPTYDAAAPLGFSFRLEAKRVATGEILATVVSDGKAPPAGPGRFVAGPGGFVREAPPAQTPAQVGDQLGIAMLTALAERWR